MLGCFSISVGLRTIEEGQWRLKKAANLVKLLALEPDHRLHRDRAMDLLWPDLDAKAAASNLYYALHVARRVLGSDQGANAHYLHLRGDNLWLYPNGRAWVDTEAFEEAARVARRNSNPAAYRVALNLYAGDLLPGDLYEDWASERREELLQLRLSLLFEIAALHERSGETGPAVEALGQVVEIEPTHEEAHAGLMRLYAASGRRHEALLQYERLKGALREVDSPGPSAEVGRLHEEILSERFSWCDSPGGASSQVFKSFPNNLPAPRTSFVGRERELSEIKRLLAMTRLLTLTGTGGSGKTRLALEVARELVGVYPDGVWLVELASLSEPELVQQEVAKVLDVREQPNRPLTDTLAAALRDREMLLVLDNCEHLVNTVAHLVDALLNACPKLRILATSREPLGAEDETRWPVPSLSLPDRSSAEDPARYEAIRLFVERARQKRPSFALTPKNAGAVVEVCRRLDGIPLAIELATARVGSLAVEQVAERLEDSLSLLDVGPRTVAPRHRTLRTTLEWSHDLLSEPEKTLFHRLSAFAGGWTLEAAEAVCPGGVVGEGEILDLLSRLVDKSMVGTEAIADEQARYRMLEPIGQYAREKLDESGEDDAVRRRHAAFFLALAEETEPESKGARREAWLRSLEIEHGNLRVALGWMLKRGEDGPSLRMGGALGEFWYTRGYHDEGRRWLEAVLANGGVSPASARVKVLTRAGYIAGDQGDYERAAALGEEGLALSRRSGDRAGAAAALHTLGTVALHRNECGEAAALLEEALALRRSMGDTMGAVRVLQALGVTAAIRRDFERAVALHEEGLPLAREMEDRLGIALFLGQGALAYLGRGDHRRADALCAEGIELSWQLGHEYTLIFVLHKAAVLAGSRGLPNRAARLWGAAEALREAAGATLSLAARHYYGPYVDAARTRIGEAAWEEAWEEGRAMASDRAVEYALSEKKPHSAEESPPTTRPLTRREREVVSLITRGLPNRRIASELSLSLRTVENHVRNILKKLGLHSREEVAAWENEQRRHTMDRI